MFGGDAPDRIFKALPMSRLSFWEQPSLKERCAENRAYCLGFKVRLKYCPICRDEKIVEGISFQCPGCNQSWNDVWSEWRKAKIKKERDNHKAKRKKKKKRENEIKPQPVKIKNNREALAKIKMIRQEDDIRMDRERLERSRPGYFEKPTGQINIRVYRKESN